jgi:hypothetical protein
MSWILFGGCEGERLHNLTGVSVSRKWHKLNICFHYDSSGLHDQELSFNSHYFITDNIKHFPIDGKGGELITTLIGAGVRSKYSLKIATNHGRSFYFEDLRPGFRPSLPPLGIAHGTTIVGLFVCQVCGIIRWRSSASANVPTASRGRNHRLRCDLGQGKCPTIPYSWAIM